MSRFVSLSGLLATLVLGLTWSFPAVSQEPAAKEKEPAAQPAKPTQEELEKEFGPLDTFRQILNEDSSS